MIFQIYKIQRYINEKIYKFLYVTKFTNIPNNLTEVCA